MKKIWHFSDTHSLHGLIKVPEGVDIAIFSGDCSNPFDAYKNAYEVRNFIEWYGSINIKHKIFVAGNHDGSIERRLVLRDEFTAKGIVYLENESIEIEGIKIWGSPVTPTFGNWYFMKARNKINRLWDQIPYDTDIIITHGPPKTILDLSYDRSNNLEFCGCSALKKRVETIRPRFVMFGHIHNCEDIKNSGVYMDPNNGIVYSNASCVKDGEFDKGPTSHGNILEYY